jgi:molecular chaperone DnaK
VKKSQVFSTAEDFQTSVGIHVTQGERTLAKDNIDLGQFMLTGLPPARRGVPQIEVTFDIDSNGILHVTAKDKASGKSQGMDIVAPHKMDKTDIEKKMGEAKEYEEADKKIREEIEAKNNAESLVYTAEHTLEEYKGKISDADKEKVNKAKDELSAAVKAEDMDSIKAKTEELKQVLGEISAGLYKGAAGPEGHEGPEGEGAGPEQGPGTDGTDSSGGSDPNIKDADFKVEK